METPTATITGNPCPGSILTATSNVPPFSITWSQNGSPVATQTSAFQINGTTIAGGVNGGSGANQFLNPDRMFVARDGTLYVPDLTNNRIQRWAPGATAGVTIAGGNGAGGAANQFSRPTSVFVDAQQNVYVTDQNNSRLQMWAPGATTGITVAAGLSTPSDVFIDAQGNIYVSEQGNSAVKKWTPGAPLPTIVAGGNGYGTASNQLSTPTGIFVDAQGNIYICDTDNNRIQKWAPGATSGTTVAGGNGFGALANQLANPLEIYVDCSNILYIADFNNLRIQKWIPGATTGTTIAGGNASGPNPNQLAGPIGVFMDDTYKLYVAEFYNHRIQVFTSSISETYNAAAPGDYTATITSASGSVSSNTITILPVQTPAVTISTASPTVCPETPVTFTATAENAGSPVSYQWQKNGINTGTSSPTYRDDQIINDDLITCIITSAQNCLTTPTAASNQLTMKLYPSPVVTLDPSPEYCPLLDRKLDAGVFNTYLWSTGNTSRSINIKNAGDYFVTVTDDKGCKASDTVAVTIEHCFKGFYAPSAFTPNDDGLNDIFRPVASGIIKKYELRIYNRWGECIFRTGDISKGWNGTIAGTKQASNIFVWSCSFQLDDAPVEIRKGTFMLIR
jgi:gliding motility-associated-like protein